MLAGVLAIRSFRMVSGDKGRGGGTSGVCCCCLVDLGWVGSFGRDNGRICVGSFPGCLQTFLFI